MGVTQLFLVREYSPDIKMSANRALFIFISAAIIFISAGSDSSPNEAQPATTDRFCKARWLKYKCLNKCSKPYVRSSWIQSKCDKCKSIHGGGEQKPVSTYSYSYVPKSSFTKTNSFCKAAWLKSKCLSDCKNNPGLCTSWVSAQCKNCNYYSAPQDSAKDAIETPVKNAIETPVRDTINTPIKDTIETSFKKTIETSIKETIATPVKAIVEDSIKDDYVPASSIKNTNSVKVFVKL